MDASHFLLHAPVTEADDDVYVEPDLCENTQFEQNDHPVDEASGCPTQPYRFLPPTAAAAAALKRIRLASFPGSGNTWVRHMLERGLGILTGSVYQDELIFDQFLGERCTNASRVLVMKTHDPWCGDFNRVAAFRQDNSYEFDYDASILLLRNPKSSFLSLFNLAYSGFNHTGHAPASYFAGVRFESYIQAMHGCWTFHSQYYLAAQPPEEAATRSGSLWRDKLGKLVLLVYYEDMKRNPAESMRHIFSFLQDQHGRELVPDVDKAVQCAVRDAGGVFHRQPPPQDKPLADPWQRALTHKSKNLYHGASKAKTLHELICSFAAHEPYYRGDDAEWCVHDITD